MLNYHEFQSVDEALTYLLQTNEKPREVGAKLERRDQGWWIDLYPTKNGRWGGSGKWLTVGIKPKEIGLFLGNHLTGLGIQLEQTDFEEKETARVFLSEKRGDLPLFDESGTHFLKREGWTGPEIFVMTWYFIKKFDIRL